MSVRVQTQQEWGTAAECNAFTGVARELVIDTTNQCIVLYDGVALGGYRQASQSWVLNQIATLPTTVIQNLLLASICG